MTDPSRARAVVLPYGNDLEALKVLSDIPNGMTSSGAVAPVAKPTIALASTKYAEAAVAGVIKRLEDEVAAGRRAWSIVEAAGEEWNRLLASTPDSFVPAQQFLCWYIAEMRGGAEHIERLDWQMAMQKLKRWRSLAFYGVDQAVSRGIEGIAFWRYVEAVCRGARADLNGGAR